MGKSYFKFSPFCVFFFFFEWPWKSLSKPTRRLRFWVVGSFCSPAAQAQNELLTEDKRDSRGLTTGQIAPNYHCSRGPPTCRGLGLGPERGTHREVGPQPTWGTLGGTTAEERGGRGRGDKSRGVGGPRPANRRPEPKVLQRPPGHPPDRTQPKLTATHFPARPWRKEAPAPAHQHHKIRAAAIRIFGAAAVTATSVCQVPSHWPWLQSD